MEKMIFSPDFLTDETIDYIDSYIIRVIINAKNDYYRKCTRHLKYNIQHVSFGQYDQDLFFEESGFNYLEKQYLKSGNISILVEDPDLMDALLQLPENHLYILLQNIVLKVPMKQIAKKLGISLRTVELYKHDALKTLRRRMIETL